VQQDLHLLAQLVSKEVLALKDFKVLRVQSEQVLIFSQVAQLPYSKEQPTSIQVMHQ